MPKRLKDYADSAKARAHRNRHRKKNYRSSPGEPGVRGTKWTEDDLMAVLAHEVPDRELSKMIGRSLESIQVMRSKLKKRGCE